MADYEIHGKVLIKDPAVAVSRSLETDSSGFVVGINREPQAQHVPLKPTGDVGTIGTNGPLHPFAKWDHKHPLPSVFSGADNDLGGVKGLVPAPSAGQQDYVLFGDGMWRYPAIATPSNDIPLAPLDGGSIGVNILEFALADHRHPLEPLFTGAGALSNGTRGGVPAPLAGQNEHYLRGNGQWSGISIFHILEIDETTLGGKSGDLLRVKTDASGIEFYEAALPSPASIVPIQPFDFAGSSGSRNEYALSDHRHPMPPVFIGAQAGVNGDFGIIPQPLAGQQDFFLSGSATWRGNFSTANPGLVPKPTAQNVTDGKILKADGSWGSISYFDLSDTTDTTYSGKLNYYVRVNSDGTGLELFQARNLSVSLPVIGASGSGYASAGSSPKFASYDHVHEMNVFVGPSTLGGAGAVPASTALNVSSGHFLRADGVWALPSVGSGGPETGIPESTFNAKGDLLVGTGTGTYTRLAKGSEGHILSVNSTTVTGLEWISNPVPLAASATPLAPLDGGLVGTGTTYARADHRHPPSPTYVGASAGVSGTKGLVPAASAGQQTFLLTGAGTWTAAPGLYAGPTTTGLVPDPGSGNNSLWFKSVGWSAIYFTNMADTPASYSGQGGKIVSVKSIEDGLEFTDAAAPATVVALASDAATGTVGTSLLYARQDHKHPIDPVFTTSLRGSVPSPGTATGRFLTDGGVWRGVFTGGVSGVDGLVPKYNAGQEGSILATTGWVSGVPAESLSLGSDSFLSKEAFLAEIPSFYTTLDGDDVLPVWQNITSDGSPTGDQILRLSNVTPGTYLIVGRIVCSIMSTGSEDYLVQCRVSHVSTSSTLDDNTISSTPPSPVVFGSPYTSNAEHFRYILHCTISDKLVVTGAGNQVVRVQVHAGQLFLDVTGPNKADSAYDIQHFPSGMNFGGGGGLIDNGLYIHQGSTIHLIRVSS